MHKAGDVFVWRAGENVVYYPPMYPDVPLWLSIAFMLGGLAALAWSSDAFVSSSAALARALGVSPFVVGMVVIGFGTSAPELCVSVLSGLSDHSNLSLGNAYGSCIFNIAVILGVAALIAPLAVKPMAALFAGPGLAAVTLFAMWLLRDGACGRGEAAALLVAFAVVLPLYCWFDQKGKAGKGGAEAPGGGACTSMLKTSTMLVVSLAALIGSAHVLVWGAVDFARFMNVSDLLIGLTIVAVGTSLPELASAVASARRGEHEFVLGNIVGSNLFNMLAVVGLATVISPVTPETGGFSRYILVRDMPLLAVLSLSIAAFGLNWRSPRSPGRVPRAAAIAWLVAFAAYTALMFYQETHG